jgi:class 3 adenylate cyclase/DNA-binding SARP family transcriptional activator/tetratricopeptide (TPR) repeat protein
VELDLLGPLQVRSNGSAVAVGGSRERAVLTRLVLSANQVVPLETLADDLWAGHPPEGAAQALWVYVSRLRKALRKHGGEGMLVTRAPGYALEIDLTALDSTRFETLVAEARAHGCADPEGAARRYREALALWRGPALADVADLPFAQGEAGRLEEARLAALEERIDADLACGRHGELIGELAGLTHAHPLRERFWAQRMTALYRAGRQAEALRAYQDLRRFLGDELGIEPTEEVRRLEAAILRHDPTLDWRPASPATVREPGAQPEAHPPRDVEPGSPAALAGVVTFLFSDLAGSTELLQTLGDDAADTLHRRYFTVLRQALASHGGTEVKSLGDGLMAAFASPLAAVSAAVAMQEAMARENAVRGTALSVRVGLHAGEAIGEGDDWFGTPVVVAQRLCDRARGGQVLASALLAGLVGNRGGHSFRALGGLALKGLSEPIAACEVVWEHRVSTGVPLPVPLERDESSIFVGRDGEMAGLSAGWEAARSGRRRVVLLVGEPGIGKTRLAAELARQVHEGGATVLFGRCDEGTGVPYQPFVEALGAYLRTARAPVLGRLGAELARLVPEVSALVADLPPPVRSDPETERYRLFDAVAAWLAAVSAESPTLLVLDDLHWATQPTLSLLAHLVRSGESLRLLVVATCRDSVLDLTAEMADATVDLLRQPGVDRLRLDGLDEIGVADFMQATARHELDDDVRALAGDLRAETGGNPFFVGQVLRHLTETGVVVRRDGRWIYERPKGEFGVPDSVRDVVSQRLARLPNETREVLAMAAVMGVSFELAPLVHAGGATEMGTLRALDPAITARLVTEAGDGYRFVHTLVRATLYDGLRRAHRLELHHRIGEAVETVYGGRLDHHLPVLATHFARAGLAQRAKASAYAARAGDRALAQLAHNEAIGWYAEALVLFDSVGAADDARRCDLLMALGEAQHRVGDRAARDTLLEAARIAADLPDAERLARAATTNHMGPGLVFRAIDTERIEVLERALAGVPPGDSVLRARVMATLAAELANSPDHERRQRLVTEAVEMALRLDDPVSLAQVLSSAVLAFVEFRSGPEQWNAMQRDIAAVSRYLGDPALEFWSVFAGWCGALMSQNLAGANDAVALMGRLGDDVGQPLLRWTAAYARSGQSIAAGRFAEAESLAHEAYELAAAAGLPDATRLLWSQLFWIRLEQGRIGEVLDVFARAGRRPGARPHTRILLCVLLCELDRLDEARPLFEALAADGFAGVQYPWVQSMAVTARACAVLGDLDQCTLLCEQLAPHHALVPTFTITTIEPVAYHLGLLTTRLGRYADAERYFDEADEIAVRMEAPHWRARINLERARMLVCRGGPGDAEQAVERAGAALTVADELGMARVAGQARVFMAPGRV